LYTSAKENDYDVVLIDTAGRMQDNEPLMRALAKLVTVNNPDKIVFVGEAVDQLSKFDRSLKDFSAAAFGVKGKARGIDGMILTKFDTIVSIWRVRRSRTSELNRSIAWCRMTRLVLRFP
jgi:signal recognition particle receptor subunit alpha